VDAARYDQPVDLRTLARQLEVDFDFALEGLDALYRFVDARNQANTAGLDLPCARGCDACCQESVFLTPLEFFAAWHWFQENQPREVRRQVIERGLDLYREHREIIEAFSLPPPEGASDHFQLARTLRFRCPLLDSQGSCLIYPARELYARMFGYSFQGEGALYACQEVGHQLDGQTVTLLDVRVTAKVMAELPLTFMRQVYPYYIHLLYGD